MLLTIKLLLISALPLVLTVLILMLPVWRAMRNQALEKLQSQLKAMVATAARDDRTGPLPARRSRLRHGVNRPVGGRLR